MKLKSNQPKVSAEQVVKDIRRATRRHYSTEDKIRIVLSGLRVRTVLLSCAARKVLRRAFTTAGAKSSWRRARSAWLVTLLAQPPATKFSLCALRLKP